VTLPPPPTLDWRAAALQGALAPLCPGLTVRVAGLVDSTNTRLLDECRAAPTPMHGATMLVAEHQHRGRGRQGRAWVSAAGASLTFSLAWRLRGNDPSGLSLAVGVALAEALDPAANGAPQIGLKWPNDLWLLDRGTGAAGMGSHAGVAAGRKLGGILIETLSRESERVAVIGIGVNVLPLEVLQPSSGVAWLRELDPDVTAPAALHRIAAPLLRALREYETTGFAGFDARYRARDLLFGRTVQAGALSGIADGVAGNGALRLRSGEHVHTIVSGEVSVRLLPLANAASSCAC
jgi:BirA family transcriptional regulator, biotin operon repressor / biotin---[acetyl-CoA-carboxylase] ligase